MLALFFWKVVYFPIGVIAMIIKLVAGPPAMEKFIDALDRVSPFSE